MIEGSQWFNPSFKQTANQAVVKINTRLVDPPPSLRLDSRPGKKTGMN
jgi:hypothetical protein